MRLRFLCLALLVAAVPAAARDRKFDIAMPAPIAKPAVEIPAADPPQIQKIDLACPAGYSPIPAMVTRSNADGGLFYNFCYNDAGTLVANSINLASLGTPGPWIRLDQFGYVADLRQTTDAVDNGTTLITSATANFTAADTGKIVWLINDGTHAVQCSVGTVTFVSSTQINTTTTCAGSGSGNHLYIGTNNYNAWVSACNSLTAAGGTIYIPLGPAAVNNTGAGNPFCSIVNAVKGDVVLWGDSSPTLQASPGAGGGATIFPAAGYTYTNGGSGDFIADSNHPGKLHMWNWGIDGQSASTALTAQALIQLDNPDIYNFTMQNFNNSSNSGYLLGWVGDTDNQIQNSFFSAIGFGGLSCNGFNSALINTFVNGGAFAYNQQNGCVTSITGGVYQDNSTSGNGAIWLNGNCGVAGLCKLSLGGNAVICGTTGVNAAMTNLGSQVQIDAAAIDTGRCSVTNGTAILIAATNKVQVTNTDISYTGTGVGVNNSGNFTSSGGNYSTTATGASLYSGTGVWSLNQNDYGPPTISGFGTSPSVTKGGNVLAFSINVGTGGVATTGTITFPVAAPNGWQINACWDITTQTAAVDITKQIGVGTTTAVTIGNFTSGGVAGAWASGDVLECQAAPY